MKTGRAARWSAWTIVGIAGLVLPCVTILSSWVKSRESVVAERVATVRDLEWIRGYGFQLSGLLPRTSADTHEEFTSRFGRLEHEPRADAQFLGSLATVEQAIRSLESRAATKDADGGISRDQFEIVAGLLATTDALESGLRTDVAKITGELAGRWLQLNLLAILSCVLAVTLALLLFAYDRSVEDRRKAEEGEQELREELAHVGRLSVVGEMGTKIAHEVNQPLGAIQGYIAGCVRRLRMHEGDPEEVIGALEKAMRETERASAIIRGLREFARHSEGRWSTVAINELVREVLPLLSPELRESGIEPELDLAEGLDPVHADRIQIEQVLVNLIRNSIEAMAGTPEDERRLIVRTSRTSERSIEVQVEDTGCGLSGDLLPNLFQPFHTTKPKGMGIGLAISRTIVEAHEGTIRAEPRRGRGAVFRFQLPCPTMVVTA